MDQVKKGSKTLLDFFQASLTKKCKSNEKLDSPTLVPITNNLSYATLSSKIGESHYLFSDEKSHIKMTLHTQRNKDKMTFNPQKL